MSTATREEPSKVLRVSLEVARATIAKAVLGPPSAPLCIGDIELAPHQCDAVDRLRREIERTGGALLADAVGSGKTYVALALAANAASPVIVAPAALRPMWTDAMTRTGIAARFVSTQRLSVGLPPLGEPDLVIVDEAHHFRNPATRRYRSLAALTRRARVLLLSATPVHNSGRELDALLAIFLGASAATLDDAERARCVIRREAAAAWGGGVPRVEPVRWIELSPRDDMLEAIGELPSPVPPSDGDDAGALLTFSLLRQWSSSDGALAAALRRRLARAAALIAALEDGRHPSKAELTAWRFADDAIQLAFPGLITSDVARSTDALLVQARAHEAAVQALLGRLNAAAGADAERAACLRALRIEHGGERIVVFSQFADTVDALWRALRRDAGVCALAGRGARVASGAISRREALTRFAPVATGAPPPGEAERISLLLTTDLLSEGVNLQDASVIVHLDLPWTPARIEQRVGRLVRPGGARERVAVYAIAPPARAESVLAVERRLREKLRAASRAAGVSGAIVPGLLGTFDTDERSPAQHDEHTRRVLGSWRANGTPAGGDAMVIARARSTSRGCLALVSDGRGLRLAGSLGGAVTDDPVVVMDAAAAASRAEDATHVDADEAERFVTRIEAWLDEQRGSDAIDLRMIAGERARRLVQRRVAAILGRAARHERVRLAPLASEARLAAAIPLGSGGERVLRELAGASLSDEAWLRAVAAFGSTHRRDAGRPGVASAARGARIVVLIVLGG